METTETKNKMVMDELFEALNKTELHSREASFIVGVIDLARCVTRRKLMEKNIGEARFKEVVYRKIADVQEHVDAWV